MRALGLGLVVGGVLVALACGGAQRLRPPDPAVLARQLHDDLVALGAIAARHRGDCPALVTALQPLVDAMRAHAAEVRRAMQDPARAPRLRREVARYDAQHRGLAETIGEDLGASYRSCPGDPGLVRVIDQLPEL